MNVKHVTIGLVAAFLAGGLWAAGPLCAGPDKPTGHTDAKYTEKKPEGHASGDKRPDAANVHAEPRAGVVTGILIARGEAGIEVKAEGEEKSRSYALPCVGGSVKEGGQPDERMLKVLQRIATNNLVQVKWVADVERKVVAIRPLPPSGKAGLAAGTVVAKGEEWIDVKPPKGGYTERYVPRWVGGMPQDGGGFDKGMVRTLGEIKVGDGVKLQWMYDERKRVVRIEKLNAPLPETADVKETAPGADRPPVTEKAVKTEPPAKTEKAEPEARPAVDKKEPGALPDGVAGFKGYVIGSVVSLDADGCGLKVDRVVPLAGSKAPQPDAFVGRQVRLLFVNLKDADGVSAPSKELVDAVTGLTEQPGPITVRAWVEGGQGLVMDGAWAGAQENPEGAGTKTAPAAEAH